MENIKLSYDIKNDNAIPYFMWDYCFTNKEIKNILISSDESKKVWLIAKIMRDARFEDIWRLLDLKEILQLKHMLEHRLGHRKKLWN